MRGGGVVEWRHKERDAMKRKPVQAAMAVVTDLCESEVDSVSEWCDHQTTVQTHVLIAIAKGACALPNDQLIRLLLPVEPQLAFPFKLTGIHDTANKQEP